MRTLVFSDSHLGVSKVFDEKKFRFLEGIIKQADQVIINGDFWEGFLLTFEQFKHTPYRHLFPLLKARHTVYIPGNHDYTGMSETDTSLFADTKTIRYEMKFNGNRLIFEHGDRLAHFSLKNIVPRAAKPYLRKPILRTLNMVEYVTTKKLNKYSSLQFMQKKLNKKIKKNILPGLKENEILIVGHTHAAEFNPKERFINTGMVKWGIGQYLMIENDKMTPHEEWYS